MRGCGPTAEEIVQVRSPRLSWEHDGVVGKRVAVVALGDELAHRALGSDMNLRGTTHDGGRIDIGVQGGMVSFRHVVRTRGQHDHENHRESTHRQEAGAGTTMDAMSTAGGVADAGTAGAVAASGIPGRSVGMSGNGASR